MTKVWRKSINTGDIAKTYVSKKDKGEHLLSTHCHHRGPQVHGAHQAASHIPVLNLPSHSQYSFNKAERMEGWVLAQAQGAKSNWPKIATWLHMASRTRNLRLHSRWSSTPGYHVRRTYALMHGQRCAKHIPSSAYFVGSEGLKTKTTWYFEVNYCDQHCR